MGLLSEQKLIWESVLFKLFDEVLLYQDDLHIDIEEDSLRFASEKTGLKGLVELVHTEGRDLKDISDPCILTPKAQVAFYILQQHGFTPYLYENKSLIGKKKWEINIRDLEQPIDAYVLIAWPGEALADSGGNTKE